MQQIKSFIKNKLWKINYIIPFTAKYLQYGKWGYIKRALPVIAKIRVIKGKGKRDVSTDILALMKNIELGILPNSSFFYWIDEYKTIAVKGNVLSNFCIDYDKVVNGSFDEFADKSIGVGGLYGNRAANIKAAIHILRNRILETIQNKSIDEDRRKCTNAEMLVLLEKTAEHFHEGLQRVLFFNQYMWQTRHGLNGLGRLDKILGNLYENDLSNGVITKADAYVMIKDFLNVLNEWYVFKSSSILGDIGQIVILGGKNVDGSYFCNDLTYMFVKAQSELKKPDPKTLLRVSKDMPDDLLRISVEALESKTGSPLFSNDDVVIPQLLQFGMPEGDSYNYCVSACWEPFIPGKSLDQNNIKAFDFYKPLDRVLRHADIDKVFSYDDLLTLYAESLQEEWKTFLKGLDSYEWACDPFVSMLTDGCNEKKLDISQGGAVYSNYGVTSIGMGSTVDSLLNLKKIIFEDKIYSLKELNNNRLRNFQDENIFNTLKTLPKKYAHDNEESIGLVNKILHICNNCVKDYVNPIGGKVKFGLSSPFYIRDANGAAADFSGRKDSDPYATHISSVTATYTEVVNFAGRIDYSGHAFNGNVVDFFVSPSFIETNIDKFLLFMKTAIKIGYFQMQMNIMDSATLIDAKNNPQKYPGLIVRVWGFSAYFNDLPEKYKDVLIERALQSEKVA